jgi:hypothetical protein
MVQWQRPMGNRRPPGRGGRGGRLHPGLTKISSRGFAQGCALRDRREAHVYGHDGPTAASAPKGEGLAPPQIAEGLRRHSAGQARREPPRNDEMASGPLQFVVQGWRVAARSCRRRSRLHTHVRQSLVGEGPAAVVGDEASDIALTNADVAAHSQGGQVSPAEEDIGVATADVKKLCDLVAV